MDPRKTPRFAKRITPYGFGKNRLPCENTVLVDKENIPPVSVPVINSVPVRSSVPVKHKHLNTCGGCLAEFAVDIKPLFPGNFVHSAPFNGFANQLLAAAEKVLKKCAEQRDQTDILKEFASIFSGCDHGFTGQSNAETSYPPCTTAATQQI